MKLYYSPNLNPRVAVAVARYLKSPVEFLAASPRHPAHEADFRPINPNTLVPVLVEAARTYWEADAIACRLSYLAGSDFWRTDARQADMVMWISWATHHLNRAGDPFYFWKLVAPTFTDSQPPPSVFEEALASWRKFMGILDAELDGKTWLVENQLSYADFRVGTVFPFAERAGLPLAEFPRVAAFAERLMELDAWREPFVGLGGRGA
jgi:glutathione S-transferase